MSFSINFLTGQNSIPANLNYRKQKCSLAYRDRKRGIGYSVIQSDQKVSVHLMIVM